MHFGGQKSDVYRSLRMPLLVSCENSERAGCGTGGKPRTSPPLAMGLSALSQRVCEEGRVTYIGGREEEGAMACRGSSDLQLLHISREAQKLNHLLDAWSKSPSFDGRSTGIAADLLRGALDLQESLIMLGKVQEASNFVAETRRKQSCYATEEEEVREMGMELMGSRRFESRVYQGTTQEPRIPVDGSSRNCREELKKVIGTSLYRQNLVSIFSDDEKASSTRSLKFPSRNGFGDTRGELGHKTGSFGTAAARQKKAKAPNLIARLMGLEEAPSEEFQPAVRSKPERKKNPIQQSHFLDIEMPMLGKLPSPEEKPDTGRKTLQEIIEAMQFKGVLRADRCDEPQGLPVEQHFRWLSTEGDAPPIVIIKPKHSASLKMEEAQKGPSLEANQAYIKEKGQFSKTIMEDAAPKSALPKEIENRVERSVAKDKVPYNNKVSASSHVKQLKKETNRISKKPDEMQKPVPDRGRLENRSVRSATVWGSQTKATSPTPTRKPENRRPIPVKNHVSRQTSSSNHKGNHSSRPATRKPIDTVKGRKTTKTGAVKEPTLSLQVDNPNSKEEDKEIIPASEKTIPEVASTLLSNLLHKEREPNSIINKRDTGKESSFHCEVMPKRSRGGGGNSFLAHALEQYKQSAITVPAESAEELKRFLFSSPTFVLHVQELFNAHRHQTVDCHKTGTGKIEIGDSKLLLDCSTQLITCKSHRFELLNHPLSLSPLKYPGTSISIDQLVDEISEEVEYLRGYNRGGDAVKDSFYGRLERDLRCNRAFSHGIWDCGWTEAVPIEEGDKTACDVEKFVLNALIEEAAVELMCMC